MLEMAELAFKTPKKGVEMLIFLISDINSTISDILLIF